MGSKNGVQKWAKKWLYFGGGLRPKSIQNPIPTFSSRWSTPKWTQKWGQKGSKSDQIWCYFKRVFERSFTVKMSEINGLVMLLRLKNDIKVQK